MKKIFIVSLVCGLMIISFYIGRNSVRPQSMPAQVSEPIHMPEYTPINSESKIVTAVESKVFQHSEVIYVLNANSTTVSICQINAQGLLEECYKQGGNFNAPYGIALSQKNAVAYITNTGNNNVLLCAVDSKSGGLSKCHETGSGFKVPSGIAIDDRQTNLAYISNLDSSLVSICEIDTSNHELVNCATQDHVFQRPTDIKMDTQGLFVYIANSGSGSIERCRIHDGNGLNNCTKISQGFSQPSGVFISDNKIYVVDNGTHLVSVCDLGTNHNGSIGCTQMNGNYSKLDDIVINSARTKAYIVADQKVIVCDVGSSGVLTQCIPSGAGFNSPSGVAIFHTD